MWRRRQRRGKKIGIGVGSEKKRGSKMGVRGAAQGESGKREQSHDHSIAAGHFIRRHGIGRHSLEYLTYGIGIGIV